MKINLPIEGLRIRRAEPDDFAAIYEIFSGPKAFSGTLQLPYPSLEQWRQRLSVQDEGTYQLVAIVEDRVVGMLGLHTFPTKPRRRHLQPRQVKPVICEVDPGAD